MRPIIRPWQEHALQQVNAAVPRPLPAPATMHWAQRAGRGPGAEILGDLRDQKVLELGCGAGRNLAHVAAYGTASAIGVDHASLQIHRARAHFGHIANVAFLTCDALDFLGSTRMRFDVVYSVFGAVGLTPPEPLLRAIVARLTQRGLLAFSVPHPRRYGQRPSDRPRLDTLALPRGRNIRLLRWEPAVEAWIGALGSAGLRTVDIREISAPDDSRWPTTLLLVARRL